MLAKEEDKILQQIYLKIQKQTSEITQKLRKEYSQNKLALKKQRLQRRQQLKDGLFQNVEQKLLDFAQTDAYQQWLLKKLQSLCDNIKGTKILLLLAKRDMGMENALQQILPRAVIQTDASIKLGGFKIIDKENSVIYDETFESKLAGQQKAFLAYSGLQIN